MRGLYSSLAFLGCLDIAKDFNVNRQRFSFIGFLVRPESTVGRVRGDFNALGTDAIYFSKTKFVSLFCVE
jgi:hypothetical protein